MSEVLTHWVKGIIWRRESGTERITKSKRLLETDYVNESGSYTKTEDTTKNVVQMTEEERRDGRRGITTVVISITPTGLFLGLECQDITE